MDRIDRLMAELDDAVARLDAQTFRPAVRVPDPTAEQAPAREAPRPRWYWTTPASAAPPPPEELAEVVAHP